jgi:hypothetical protein
LNKGGKYREEGDRSEEIGEYKFEDLKMNT